MNYQAMYEQYTAFLASPRNQVALQQLRPLVEPVLQRELAPDRNGRYNLLSHDFANLMGRYLARISGPSQCEQTLFGYLYVQDGWCDQPGQPPLTQKECTRFALLAEYAYRSGSALGAVMLYVCYHFGVGVPQSFRQAVYFARLALAGLAAPENTGLLQHPDDESSHSFWQRALFSYIAGDCLRARLQTRSRDTLYDPYCLDMTELFDMLAILPECLSAAVREPSDKKDSANLIQIVLQCIRQTMDRPFADELKQDAHQKFLYADRNLQANPQAARENWVSAVNLYVQAALLGDAEGAAGVGYCCEHHPLGSSQATRELALSWYRQAAKMGSGWAMERVGQYYAMGLCGTADPQLAQQCYDQARRMGQPVKA